MAGVKAMSAGDYHTMVLKQDDSLWATGDNAYGQLGDGSPSDYRRRSFKQAFQQILTGVKTVAAGRYRTMVVKQDGSLWVTGHDEYGQLGDGSIASRNTFKQVMNGVKAVSTGGFYTMVVKQDGTLWSTVNNMYGQIGNGRTHSRNTFKQITPGMCASCTAGFTISADQTKCSGV